MSKIKFSLVIPVFNVKAYILQCIQSVMEQTYSNFEVIIVDDCSTDGSVDLLKNASEIIDQRVKIVRTPRNSGLSFARNYGLSFVSGEYVWFVDSDDFIDVRSLEVLNNCLLEEDYDVILFNTKLYYSENNIKDLIDILKPGSYSGVEFVKSSLRKKALISACNKIYRVSLLRRINFEFPVGLWYEDTVTINLFSSCSKIRKIQEPLYFYRQRPGSITKEFSTRLLERYDVFLLVKTQLQTESFEYKDDLILFFGKVFLLETLNNVFLHSHPIKDKEKVSFILSNVKNLPETLLLKEKYLDLPFSKQEKLLLSLYFVSPYLYGRLYKCYNRLRDFAL